MNPVAPCVPKRLNLLWFTRDLIGRAILHIPARRAPLKIRVELDSIRRVDVDALHLPAQPLALGEAGHHLQGVAEDHPVRPVLIVLVELRLGLGAGEAVEVGEEVEVRARLFRLALAAPAQEIVDQHLRMDLLLNVERRCRYDEIRPILLVLPPPDQLRIEIAVAPLVRHLNRTLIFLLDQ